MSVPKEPRQLMINLMYLVLTAMLALNVSSEILHAFKTINKSIGKSNDIISEKNQKIYNSFDAQLKDPATRDRVKAYNDKAIEVKAKTEMMMAYIEKWKDSIISTSGGYEIDGEKKEIKSESDIDASTKLMVEMNGGDELKTKLEELRTFFLSKVKPSDPNVFAKQLPLSISEAEKTDNNPKAVWKIGYFQSMPVMAAVTLLSKFQNDIKNSEAMILNQLNSEAGENTAKFDELQAFAVPTQSYVLANQKVEAKIMMVAYNSNLKPVINVSGGHMKDVTAGVGNWETTATGVGLQTVKGTVSVDLGGGRIEKRDYKFEYMVGSEGASMQLDKMNVFYIGVPNPVTVSAAGYSLEDVSLGAVEGGTVTKTANGKFDLMLTKPNPELKVSIIAKTQGGGSKEVGSMKVRVKYIPDPIAVIGKKAGGYFPVAQFRAQIGVEALLQNFEFDARYVVTEFAYSVMKKRDPDLKGPYKVQGPVWSGKQEIMSLQRDLKPGDRVFIDDIKAKGPDGRTRPLNPLTFTMT